MYLVRAGTLPDCFCEIQGVVVGRGDIRGMMKKKILVMLAIIIVVCCLGGRLAFAITFCC